MPHRLAVRHKLRALQEINFRPDGGAAAEAATLRLGDRGRGGGHPLQREERAAGEHHAVQAVDVPAAAHSEALKTLLLLLLLPLLQPLLLLQLLRIRMHASCKHT